MLSETSREESERVSADNVNCDLHGQRTERE